jgi:hypothetical protein
MNREMSDTTVDEFLDGLERQVLCPDRWGTGFVWAGDTEKAGTVEHQGEEMSREEYERRLEEYREKREAKMDDTPDTIVIEVVEADSEPFEQERYGPEEERPQL